MNKMMDPISGTPMVEPLTLPCNHTFEKSTLETLLKINKKCPICKKPVKDIPKPNMTLQALANLKLKASKIVKGLSMRSTQPKLTDKLLEKLSVSVQTDGIYYNVNLNVPECEERRQVAIVCIIDVSGSMGTVVGRAEGKKAFTRLDLVKHVINVLITSLNKDDYLALIKFSDDSDIVLDLSPMTDENKLIAKSYVKDLDLINGTTTAPAIKLAYDLFNDGPQNYINSILLLTDGVDSCGEDYLRSEYDKLHKQRDVQFNTFGFSSDIWSHLLQELALKGGGIFGYIPDQTMIGTIFINFLANTLLTYDQGIYIDIDENYEFVFDQHPRRIALSYGQSRNFLLRKIRKFPDNLPVLRLGKSRLDMIEFQPTSVQEKVDLSKQIARHKLLKFCFDSRLPRVYAKDYEDSPDLKLEQFLAEFKQLDPSDHNQQQLKLSLTYWSTWGQHYVRSFVFAHLFEQCLNFKAPSMSIYITPIFQLLVDELTDLFCTLEPPVPTGVIYSGYDSSNISNINMNNLMDPRGGCILETCKVKLVSGLWLPIGNLRKNDILLNGAKVVCIIKTLYDAPLIKIGNLAITAFHPIFFNNKWQFPIDLVKQKNELASIMKLDSSVYVCNIVLDKVHVVDVEGINCITLGHGFEEDILKHPYYGSKSVINEMSKFKGWNDGLIKLKEYSIEKDENGLVCSTRVHQYDE